MPILGITASGITGSTISTSSYESIATVTVGSGGSSSIAFSSIPQTYKHLQMRYISADARGTYSNSPVDMTFNGSSATAYDRHVLTGDGSNAASFAEINQNFIRLEGGANVANTYLSGIVDILDYTSTSKAKTVRSFSGIDANAGGNLAGEINLNSGLWYATPAAITSITLTPYSSPFRQYTQFALYGIKGA